MSQPRSRTQLRPADLVMRPETLAAMQPSALSGTRALIARMSRERWRIALDRLEVDAESNGLMIYSVQAPGQLFSLIAFTFTPRTEGRTGRIIGRAWDMMCALVEGPATEAQIETARVELPKLYRGRATPQTLVWGRSNRSMRVFAATQAALMAGRQPGVGALSGVCYLMRNTGLDGNGTFGTRPFADLGARHALGGMLEAQLLVGYLMRELSCDLVSHLARLHAPATAVPLAPELRRYIGVGNGSALGLIFYVQKHPRLIESWLRARETAIAEARGLPAGQVDWDGLAWLLDRAIRFRAEDRMQYESFTASAEVARDLERVRAALPGLIAEGGAQPLDRLVRLFEGQLSPEAFEMLLSLLIEQVAERAAELARGVGGGDELALDPAATVADLAALIEAEYAWALGIDMTAADALDYVWYKSETAEEPRRGLRTEIPEARDLGLDLPGDIQRLLADLKAAPGDQPLARFLMRHPGHRFVAARIQTLRGLAYHTPHANIHSGRFVPIDLVRLMNVGLHGIDKTRDFLQRNLRGVLYHGAPLPDEIARGAAGRWFYPPEPNA